MGCLNDTFLIKHSFPTETDGFLEHSAAECWSADDLKACRGFPFFHSVKRLKNEKFTPIFQMAPSKALLARENQFGCFLNENMREYF